jgi:hypothetical protein
VCLTSEREQKAEQQLDEAGTTEGESKTKRQMQIALDVGLRFIESCKANI